MGDALHLLPHPPLTASLERRRIFALTFIVVLHFNGHLRLLVSFFFFLLEGDVHVIYLNASLRRGSRSTVTSVHVEMCAFAVFSSCFRALFEYSYNFLTSIFIDFNILSGKMIVPFISHLLHSLSWTGALSKLALPLLPSLSYLASQ